MSYFYDKAKYNVGMTIVDSDPKGNVSVLITEITAPATPASNVTFGKPVVIGDALAGIALDTPASSSSILAVATSGVYCINVTLASAGHIGDPVTINPTTAIVSDSKAVGQIPFGFLLDDVSTTGAPTKAIVKVLPMAYNIPTDNT